MDNEDSLDLGATTKVRFSSAHPNVRLLLMRPFQRVCSAPTSIEPQDLPLHNAEQGGNSIRDPQQY